MAEIWNFWASSGASSTLTLPKAISGCSWASSSTTGESMVQGPHQAAQKSSRTGEVALVTFSSKLFWLMVVIAIFSTPFKSRCFSCWPYDTPKSRLPL